MNVNINRALLSDLEQHAHQRGLSADRFASEIVEAYVSGLRLKRLPPSGGAPRHGAGNPSDSLRSNDDHFGPLAEECYRQHTGS